MKIIYLIFIAVFSFASIQAQIVNISNANFKNALINHAVAKLTLDGPFVDVDTNNDGEIQVSEAEAVLILNVFSKNISSLEGIAAFTNMVQLYCHLNFLSNLDLTQNPSLTYVNCVQNNLNTLTVHPNVEFLTCGNNNIATLDVSLNDNMTTLLCQNNQLTSLLISNSSSLNILKCQNNLLTNIDVSGNTGLVNFECNSNNLSEIIGLEDAVSLEKLNCSINNLSELNLQNCVNLKELNCSYSSITTLDLTANVNLESLYCHSNELSSINLTQNEDLFNLNCSENQLLSLDLTQNVILDNFDASSNQLINLYIKNGATIRNNGFNFSNNPNISYVCVDDSESLRITNYVYNLGYNGCAVNSFCTTSGGGVHQLLEGTARIDTNLNGCSASDLRYGGLKLNLSDGTTEQTYITNSSGNYSIPIHLAEYTITPILENFDYFTVTPSPLIVDFNNEVYPYNQNFCIVPDGDHDDLEVVIIPLENARPGFNTTYEIVFNNKGTTTLSGNVILTFEEDYMNFISAEPLASSVDSGQLTWTYSNLVPFESRAIQFKMLMNTPTDPEFPLVSGDGLNFSAQIDPTNNEETPDDNMFILQQTVVNSFDPNDKTCLQGDIINVDEVGGYVHYVIRFENTGTSNAENIVIKDMIDTAKYDINTLKPLTGSHSFVTKIKDINKVEFIFENINLPFEDDTNDGYVAFKIKTQASLVLGDTFSNTAEIYFDFNEPIITNTAVTTVSESLSVEEAHLETSVKLYPNPSNDILFIESKNMIKSLSIYDMNDRALQYIIMDDHQFSTSLNIKDFKTGIYLFKLSTAKGELVKKIVKN